MKQYSEIIDSLTEVIHTKRDKERADKFRELITELKDTYGVEVSTKFLRGLLSGGLTFRQKTKKINYLMSRAGLKTERRLRYYAEKLTHKYSVAVREYTSIDFERVSKDNLIEFGEIKQYDKITTAYGLSEEEAQQIREIEQVKESTGIDLFNYGMESHEERNRVREAVYNKKCGIVRLKNSHEQKVGKEFIGHFSEVLFIVRV